MLRQRLSFVFVLGILCVLGMFLTAGPLRAQDTSDPGPRNISVFDVGANPSPNDVASLSRAFRQGHVVRVVGEPTEKLGSILGLGLVKYKLTTSQTRPVPKGQVSSSEIVNQAENRAHVSAVHADAKGALHVFLGATGNPADTATWQPAFNKWLSQRRGLTVQDGPTAPDQAWTLLYNLTTSQSSSAGGYGTNNEQYSIQIYRLNVVAADPNNPPTDKYMVIQQPQGQPSMYFTNCAFACGFWNNLRSTSIRTSPMMKLLETEPPDQIEVTTVSFTIGASVGPSAPSVSPSLSFTWSQDSVTTQNTSSLAQATASWQENFVGPGAFGYLPDTSKDLFFSYSGAIFEVPAGTTSFSVDTAANFRYQIDNGFVYWYATDGIEYSVLVSPPIFAVNVPSLTIAPANTETIEVTSAIPGSKQGLPWEIDNLPSWLSASQTSGGGSASLSFTVEPGTALGLTASLNFNTNPAFAAPSVATNPLKVQVTVGQPPSTGILITGGTQITSPSDGGTVLNASELYIPASGIFSGTGAMTSSRTRHQASALLNSQVLLTGGVGAPASSGANTVLASAEIYDPSTASFTALGGVCPGAAGCMTVARQNHTATVLPSGKVLIVGGVDRTLETLNINALASAELYDPVTKTFSATGSLSTARMFHTATLLQTGDVLIAGGQPVSAQAPVNTGEIYKVSTGQFTLVPSTMSTGHDLHSATLLKDGNVLLAGGYGTDQNSTAAADLYVTSSNSFMPTGPMKQLRTQHAATLLNDGTVLMSGGAIVTNGGFGFGVFGDAELYDPLGKAFTLISGASACPGASGCLLTGRYAHQATLGADGRVLLSGGLDGNGITVSNTELYDSTAKTFVAGPALNSVASHTATLVRKAATALTLASSLPVSNQGDGVTFTAVLSTPGAGMPSGAIVFTDGGKPLGTAAIANSQAALTIATLEPGNHQIVAGYAGDNGFTGSTSATFTQTVNRNTVSVTLSSSANPANPGQSITLSAVVTAKTGQNPTGTVSFQDGATTLGTAPLNAGSASLRVTALTGGSHSIVASYSGDPNFSPASSPAVAQVVNLTPSTTALSSSANPSKLTQAVTLTASVSSSLTTAATGTVTFLEGATTLGKANVSGGQAVLSYDTFGIGPHSITAVYSGDTVYATSTSTALLQTVTVDPVQVLVTSGVNPSAAGQAVIFMVAVTSSFGTPGGSVTILDGTTSLGQATLSDGKGTLSVPILSSGSHLITASYPATASFGAGTSPVLTQLVNRSTTTAATVSSQNPSNLGQPVTLTARITSSGSGPITGTVNFIDGGNSLGSSAVTGGVATLTTSSLAAGSHSITADYVGDSNFSPSVSSAFVQVVNNTSTTTTVTSSMNPSTVGQPVSFVARIVASTGTGNPSGTILFRDGTVGLGSIPLSNGQATFIAGSLTSGTHAITAVYSGDPTYSGSTSAVLTQTVNNPPTTTTLTSSVNPSIAGQDVTLVARVAGSSGTPTGAVTFRDGAVTLGSIPLVNGQASFTASGLTAGSHPMTANYAGDGTFAPSTSATLVQVVNTPVAPTTTTLNSSPNPSEIEEEVTIVATVATATPGAALPTGSVTLSVDGVSKGSMALSGGKATWKIKFASTTPVMLTATYSGSAGLGASSGSMTQIINPLQQ